MAIVIRDWVAGNPNLEEDLKLMRNKAEALFARAADINTEVRNAELHPGKKRKREVDNWMRNAQELKIEMECIEEEVDQGASSNRKRLRNQIVKITKEMEEVLQHATFTNGLTIHDLASSSLPLVTTNMTGQQFEENLRMILSWLMADEVSKIGVYGVGGVGKTTLAMHIHNQLLHVLGKCASVYWVTASQECTILKLQDKIAKELNLSHILAEADTMKRPAILSEALKKRSNVVIILDDMWNHFPLEKVGVPAGENGCKLLLTSRSLEVCRKMACQKQVKIRPLSKEESWSLFAERLGNCDEILSLEAKDIAKLVVKECAGLPLGIIVVAASMSGVFDVYEWSNTLEELTKSTRIHEGMETEVFPSLQLSYTRLNDVKLQNCFLSCALYAEDSTLPRDKLVNLWIMEGHLEEIQSWRQRLNLAHTFLNRLISACLLDATDTAGNYVKMHDLIRDMAISISSQRHQGKAVMIKASMQLREVPRLQEWTEELTKVSLVSNNIREIPSGMTPRCPNISSLLLEENPMMTIPGSFFLFLNGLKFLDLTRTSIERVPDQLSYLENLSALKLAWCDSLIYVPSLAKLAKLRHLDLSFCHNMNVLPQGMEKLVNLQCLILRGSNKFCVPFSELASGISNIQCLELSCGVKETQIQDIQKLGCLERLTGFHIHDTGNFNTYVKSQHFHQLTSYQLILGSSACRCFLECFHSRSIIIGGIKFEGGAEPAKLPHNIQELLVLSSDFHVKSLVDALPSLNGLTRLIRISLCQCKGIESIWSESSCAKPKFEYLEVLILSALHSFRGLAKGRVKLPPGSLSNLKRLKVQLCPALEKLFTPCLLNSQLRNLEEIEILSCVVLEEIFSGFDLDDDSHVESGDAALDANQVNTMIVELSKLRILSLHFVERLVRTRLVCCKSIEEITMIDCPELKKLPLAVEVLENGVPLAPPCLQKIIVERDWWESLVWDNPHMKQTLQPFVEFPTVSE